MAAFRNVVLYGAGGPNIGQAILDALYEDGNFNITVLARQSSKASYPPSVKVARVPDDLPHAELVAALKGQDVVVSAVGTSGIASQTKVIDAAVEAGVKRFVPSEYGLDNDDPVVVEMSPICRPKAQIQEHLEAKAAANPGFSWHVLSTSIWLEWALDVDFIDINTAQHTVSYWDDGAYSPSHTTLAYAGKALVETLKHARETHNRRVFSSAFTASQRDIVAELERQQGVAYSVGAAIDGPAEIAQLQARWAASGATDYAAAFRTITAGLFVAKYGSDFERANKQPRVESFAQMPKLTLEDVVREFLAKQSSK